MLFKSILPTFLFLLYWSFANGQSTVVMKKENGVWTVPCTVNGLNLRFIFDTGASSVSISLTEAMFMLKNGYLKEEDIGDKQSYQDASGNISEGTKIIIREIEFAGMKLYNIEASVVNNIDAPLLLGQTAISKLGKIQIDPAKGTLTFVDQKAPSSNSLNVNTEIKEELGYLRFYKNSVSDFKILKQTYYDIINIDTTNSVKTIIDITYWFESEKKYFEFYDTCFGFDSYQGHIDTSMKNDCYNHLTKFALGMFERELYSLRANSKFSQYDYVGSLSDFNNSLLNKEKPNETESGTVFNIGVCYYKLKELDDACKYFRMAGELGFSEAYDVIKENCNYIK